MPLEEAHFAQLQNFFNQSHFPEKGGVITDLDGTAIHEYEGRLLIPQSVELGLKKIYDLGRPVVINTLRFPLSVMRTFGKDWYTISNNPIPTVLMNGSQLGFIAEEKDGNLTYQELAAYPLKPDEINEVMEIVANFMDDKMEDLLVFFYPRQWQKGEIIWTPAADRIEAVQKKYQSASTVISGPLANLEAQLKQEDICMIFLLIDLPQDKLMAYQHTKRSSFFTTKGVDKKHGTEQIANLLQFELTHSLGAGDSEMDTFLSAVGQAVHVGNPFLKYEGQLPAIKVKGSAELGDLLFQLAAMQKNIIH